MELKQLACVALLCGALTACGGSVRTAQGGYYEGAYQINKHDQRINTIDCKDLDDWYLDGYRVGKSFRNDKQTVLAYRLNYCQQKFQKSVDESFTAYWERGFAVGEKDVSKPARGKKYKSKKRRTA